MTEHKLNYPDQIFSSWSWGQLIHHLKALADLPKDLV